MKTLATLRVKIYADGADKQSMLQMNADPLIKGMTTNPTLMRKAGLKDFEALKTFEFPPALSSHAPHPA